MASVVYKCDDKPHSTCVYYVAYTRVCVLSIQTAVVCRQRSNSEVVAIPTSSSHLLNDSPCPPLSLPGSISTPMSHLLLSNDGHVGPDEFIQLVYRNTATNATDIDDTMVTARRRRRVSSYLLT